jgi:hypothetical protein
MSAYKNPNKVYVDVGAQFGRGGVITPLSFVWEDGSEYEVDQVLEVRRAASLKAGGVGMRYTCRVRGRQTFLFLEDDRWFMERKGQ